MDAQRQAMLSVFRASGISRATYVAEVAAVARASAAEGEYSASGKLYELVGKALGSLGNEQHLHVHTSDPSILASQTRLAQLTDAQLMEMAQMRRVREAEVVSVAPGDDPLFS